MKNYIIGVLVCAPFAVLGWQAGPASVGLTPAALQGHLERATRGAEGLKLPSLGAAQIASVRAMGEAEQIGLMRDVAAATKALVMSPAFQSAHEAYIAKEYKAVNHGIKATSLEQAAKGANSKAGASEFEAKIKRDMAAMYVKMAMETKIDDLRMMFDSDLKDWTRNADNVKRSNRAKYQKLVAAAAGVQAVSASDPDKFRRGYAVLKSAEADGPDTEAAVFGAQAGADAESEQLMWDTHNLRGQLKRTLTQLVAEAATVDFSAQTVMKDGTRVFTNPAYEKKSLTWKAMYRAGKSVTAAGIPIARAWLKEL